MRTANISSFEKTETIYAGVGFGDFVTGFNLASDLEFNTLSSGPFSAAFDYYNTNSINYYFESIHYK